MNKNSIHALVKKVATLLSVSLCVATSLITSVSANAKPVEITFWHSISNEEEKTLDKLVDDFNQTHADIHVNAIYNGKYADIITKLKASIPARRSPDLAVLEATQYGGFAEAGVLENLLPYQKEHPEFVQQMQPFALSIGEFSRKDTSAPEESIGNYITPFNSSTPLMYVNKKLLRDAGFTTIPEMKNLDQILAVAQQVQEKIGGDGIYGINTPSQFSRFALVMQNGGDWIDPKTNEFKLDQQAAIDAYQWAGDLYSKYHVASAQSVTDEKNVKQDFNAGRVAIHMDSTGNLSNYRKNLGDDLLVLPMPCTVVCRVPIGGAGIGMLKNISDEHKAASWEFMQYLASAPASAVWFKSTGYMPVNKTALETEDVQKFLKENPDFTVAMSQLPFAEGRARPAAMAWIRAQEFGVWESIALGQKSASDALQGFADQVKPRLK